MFVSHLLVAAFALCWGPSVAAPMTAPLAMQGVVQDTPAIVEHFPLPTEGLSIPAPQEGGPSLLSLLGDFSRATGQNLHASDETRARLRETSIGLMWGVDVPPSEVYSFVESLLWESGFVLFDERDTVPRMLAIKWLRGGERERVRQGCVTVPAANIEAYKRHPALMIQTVVEVPDVDHQKLSNVLRVLVTDNYTQQVAVVDGSVILVGPGRQVAHMAEMLRSVNGLSSRVKRARERARQELKEKEGKQEQGGD